MSFDQLILVSFIAEVVLLAVMEIKLWGTVYTPLNIVMLPTALVVFLSIWVVNTYQLYPFYAPCLFVWMAGLLFFALPSYFFRRLTPSPTATAPATMPELPNDRLVFAIGMAICLVFLLHLRSALSNTASMVGSDEFADEASSHGFWGHLFCLVIFSNIISMVYLSKKRWYFAILLLLGLAICVINQVKGWVIIPLIAGLFINIYLNRIHLSTRLVLSILVGGSAFFFLSYYLSLVVSEDQELSDNIIFFIFKNFLHYITSGILGLSMDMDRGIIEPEDPGYLFSVFINFYNAIADEPMLSSLNSIYFATTWEGHLNNVRSFMGTTLIFGGKWLFPVIVMLVSSAAYAIRTCWLRSKSLSWLLVDGWMSAILAMAWFDWYFALLRVYEVFIVAGLAPLAYYFFFPKGDKHDEPQQA